MKDIFEYKCFLFDMDGVIIDSMEKWYSKGIEILSEYINPSFTYNDPSIHEKIWDAINALDNDSREECRSRWYNAMSEEYLEVSVKEGVIEFLELAKSKNIKLCIGTGTPLRLALPPLKRLGLLKYFDEIQDIHWAKARKSSGKLYRDLADLLHIKYEDCIVFEDTYKNMLQPKIDGFTVIGVYDYISRDYKERIINDTDRYIESFKELING